MDNSITAHELAYHPKERMELFQKLTRGEQAALFEELSPYVQQDIIGRLKNRELVELLDQMDLRSAERVLARLKSERRRKKLIARLKGELKEKAEYFLRFHPKATLSLLNFNYVLLSTHSTIGEAADAIDEHYEETGKLPEVLVHEEGELVGEVPPSVLVRESNSDALKKHVVTLKSIAYEAEPKEVVASFTKKKHGKVAVLDKDGSVIGVIYSNDVLELFGNKSTSALYNFAGVSESERAIDGIGTKVRNRYKWLVINLGTAFLAASVVNLFEDTLSQLVILAVYMPVIAGMGGNAATQTLAVIVRGITVGEISLKTGTPAILKEAGAGFVNGMLNGIVIAIIATIWNGDPMLGLVLGGAMVVNLVVAGFFGAFVPLAMKAMGKDPATSATIFITTATDVFGFFVFLSLATLLLL